MSGMAWPNRGLKDMTSMSGLRQELPQDFFNTPGAARRAADCLRFASPAEATGRLGELDAGGLEDGKIEKIGRSENDFGM